MATLTSTACQTSSGGFFLNPPKYIEQGMIVRGVTYTFAAAQSAGDVIQMMPIPKGAVVADVIANFAGLGGASLTVTSIGDGNSTGRYGFNSVSTNVANVVRATKGVGYSYSAEDTIDIIIGTATSASAGTTVYLEVLYSMDQSTDGQGS